MLNVKYICDKTLLREDDELVPIILNLMRESYKSGFCQAEFDTTINLLNENQDLKMKLYNKEHYINKLQTAKDKCGKKNGNMINQQKEFIKWLEDEINSISCSKSLQLNGFDVESIVKPYREVLQKYKEIIGDDKNEK